MLSQIIAEIQNRLERSAKLLSDTNYIESQKECFAAIQLIAHLEKALQDINKNKGSLPPTQVKEMEHEISRTFIKSAEILNLLGHKETAIMFLNFSYYTARYYSVSVDLIDVVQNMLVEWFKITIVDLTKGLSLKKKEQLFKSITCLLKNNEFPLFRIRKITYVGDNKLIKNTFKIKTKEFKSCLDEQSHKTHLAYHGTTCKDAEAATSSIAKENFSLKYLGASGNKGLLCKGIYLSPQAYIPMHLAVNHHLIIVAEVLIGRLGKLVPLGAEEAISAGREFPQEYDTCCSIADDGRPIQEVSELCIKSPDQIRPLFIIEFYTFKEIEQIARKALLNGIEPLKLSFDSAIKSPISLFFTGTSNATYLLEHKEAKEKKKTDHTMQPSSYSSNSSPSSSSSSSSSISSSSSSSSAFSSSSSLSL